jgi:hypothetical protein
MKGVLNMEYSSIFASHVRQEDKVIQTVSEHLFGTSQKCN